MSGRAVTTQQPPASFISPSRTFFTPQAYRVEGLNCQAMYASSQFEFAICGFAVMAPGLANLPIIH